MTLQTQDLRVWTLTDRLLHDFRSLTTGANYCVNYPDGVQSLPVDYLLASSLASVFGGRVVPAGRR